MTLWRAFLVLLWCAVFACAALLIGEYTGRLDPSLVGRVLALLPSGLNTDGLRDVSPTPTPEPESALLPTPASVLTETCTPGQPIFVHGAATLNMALGGAMGQPLECERVTDADGDTEQQTSTGLVYYRASTNAVAFTNGFDHWALAPGGVVHWTGDALVPPASAEPRLSAPVASCLGPAVTGPAVRACRYRACRYPPTGPAVPGLPLPACRYQACRYQAWWWTRAAARRARRGNASMPYSGEIRPASTAQLMRPRQRASNASTTMRGETP